MDGGVDLRPERKRKVWPWLVVAAVVIFFLPVLFSSDEDSPSSGPDSQSSASQAVRPGIEASVDEFAVRVPQYGRLEFVTSVGSGYSAKSVPDSGTYFCLVPVCIANRTTATATFLPSNWYLHADGFRFETATGVDYYLDEEDKLDAHDVPPGITRCGKIVFLVTSRVRQAAKITLELNDWGNKTTFDLSSL